MTMTLRDRAWRSGWVAAACAALACWLAPVAAAADFYAGKTIELEVGADVGGGYDIYARTVARHMGRHIPGNPTIVVKNMPGAGSGRTAVYISNVAPRMVFCLRASSKVLVLDDWKVAQMRVPASAEPI